MADKYEIEIVPTYTEAALSATKKFFGDAIGKAASAISSTPILGQGLKEAGAVGGMVASAGGAAVGSVTGIADMLGKFVSAFNPAIMEQFGQAVNDVAAVIGRALAPAFEILTPLVQMFGDFIASILPDAGQMRAMFKALSPALETMKNAMGTLAPLLNSVLVVVIQGLANVIQVVVKMMDGLAKAFAQVAIFFLKLIPAKESAAITQFQRRLEAFVRGDSVPMDKSSRGQGYKAAEFKGVGSLTESTILAAYGMGGDPQARTANNTEAALAVSKEINAKLSAVLDKFFGAGSNLGANPA